MALASNSNIYMLRSGSDKSVESATLIRSSFDRRRFVDCRLCMCVVRV